MVVAVVVVVLLVVAVLLGVRVRLRVVMVETYRKQAGSSLQWLDLRAILPA